MKKYFILIIMLLTIAISGCVSSKPTPTYSDTQTSSSKSEYFVTVYSANNYDIVYDKNTKVMYCMSNGAYNRGNLSVLYDEYGNILLYK